MGEQRVREDRALFAFRPGRLAAVLTPRERRIVALRFQHDLTQQEIGELVGLSQMQISRILLQAIAKLRDYAAAERARGEVA